MSHTIEKHKQQLKIREDLLKQCVAPLEDFVFFTKTIISNDPYMKQERVNSLNESCDFIQSLVIEIKKELT